MTGAASRRKGCTRCLEVLPIEQFSASKANNGFSPHCKACAARIWQAYQEKRRAARAAMPRPQTPPGQWKDVSPIHAVSSDGRIWSYRHGRLLAGTMSRDGYRKVPIGRKSLFLHRLVAESFVPGSGEQVRHKDGDKLNNCADNLEWGTCRENILDKWKHGKMVIGEKHHNNKIPEAEIPNIRASKESNRALGEKYGVSRTAIYLIRKGKNYGWL